MKALGKSIVLIMLIIIMALGGLLWFDYLGVVRLKSFFTPIYKILGKEPPRSHPATSSHPITVNLDEERLSRQRQSLDLFKEELDKREEDIIERERQNEMIASELSSREKSLEEREKTFNQTQKQYDDKNVNIEQIALNLNGMQPQVAVEILVAMDDQTVIDILRKVEEIARRTGASSMGSYWLSLMPSDRAAQIQRKMISKPESLE